MQYKFAFLTLTLTLLADISIFAQDVIITNNDEIFKVYNMEIGKNVIFYQLSEKEDAPIQKINKTDVFVIKKQDGTKIDPNELSPSPATSAAHGSTPVFESTPKNNQLIAEWNAIKFEIPNARENASPVHNPSLLKMGVKSNSALADNNLQVRYKMEIPHSLYPYVIRSYKKYDLTKQLVVRAQAITITVTNLTDKMIFVDMANSVFSSFSGTQSMYSGKVSSTTNVDALGVSVGLIGGASASATSVTTVEQRMIPVPPHGTRKLPFEIYAPLCPATTVTNIFANPLADAKCADVMALPVGQSLTFSEDTSINDMFIALSYSFSESGTEEQMLMTSFYLQQILKLQYCPAGTFVQSQTGLDKLMPQTVSGLLFVPLDPVANGCYTNYENYCTK